MDMYSVDLTMTGSSRAARERTPEIKHVSPTSEGGKTRSDEAGHVPGLPRGRFPRPGGSRSATSSKVLAALSEQQDDGGDLPLPADKLRRMIEG